MKQEDKNQRFSDINHILLDGAKDGDSAVERIDSYYTEILTRHDWIWGAVTIIVIFVSIMIFTINRNVLTNYYQTKIDSLMITDSTIMYNMADTEDSLQDFIDCNYTLPFNKSNK